MGVDIDDLFDVVWAGGPLLPPREQHVVCLGLFAIDREPRRKADRPGRPRRNRVPIPGAAVPAQPQARTGMRRWKDVQEARRAEWLHLFECYAPKLCRCGCGAPLTQASVTLHQARKGLWSRYLQGHHVRAEVQARQRQET